MELQELQENEAEALKAIYMDDFVDTTKSSAWNVSIIRGGGGEKKQNKKNAKNSDN